MFWEILQNPQENTCASIYFLIKLKAVSEYLWATASSKAKLVLNLKGSIKKISIKKVLSKVSII